MILMPFAKPQPYIGLREQIIGAVPQIFYYFYEPWEHPNESIAHCEAQINDENDVKKFLISALKPYIKLPSDQKSPPVFTKP